MKMKRIVCAVLALLMVGCAPKAPAEEESFAYVYPALQLDSDAKMVGTEQVVLYYLSDDEQRLVPTLTTVAVLPGETLLEAAVNALLSEPEDQSIKPVLPLSANMHLLGVEQSNKIATVNLSGRFSDMDRERQFAARMAIINTLVQTGQVEYVNVLIEGKDIFSETIPAGTASSSTYDLKTAYLLHTAANSAENEEQLKRDVTLYFVSAKGDLLIPEVRRVTVTSGNYIAPVIAELIKGPRDVQNMRRTLSPDTVLLTEPVVQYTGQGTSVELNFSYSFNKYLEENTLSSKIIYGALVNTLFTFVPNLTELRILINGRAVSIVEDILLENGNFYRDAFNYMVGSTVELCFPDEENQLHSEIRVVPQSSGSGLRILLEELIAGPQAEHLHSPFPQEFTVENVLGVLAIEGMAIVNLDEAGLAMLDGMPDEEEYACVYSIVNTLSLSGNVRRVLFLCQGMPCASMQGKVDLREPLVYNNGIDKE